MLAQSRVTRLLTTQECQKYLQVSTRPRVVGTFSLRLTLVRIQFILAASSIEGVRMAHTFAEAQVEVAEPITRMTAQLKTAEKDARDAYQGFSAASYARSRCRPRRDERLGAQYVKIAKVALRGKKQLLEKIGVTARASKTAAQRAAPNKEAAARAANKA